MATGISRVNFPEIFIGFVSPIGADVRGTIHEFRRCFTDLGYQVVEIKVTNMFRVLKNYVQPRKPLVERPLYSRYETYIAYGDQLREHFNDNSLFAMTSVNQVARKRLKLQKTGSAVKTVYLIHQFKRKEEIDLLRSVYGSLFFQVSVYSRRGARVDHLSRDFAKSSDTSGPYKYKHYAEKLIQEDEDEASTPFGQRVGKVFHDADFIVSLDTQVTVGNQVSRFCELIFGSNRISPTRVEYGMFLAKAAGLRTLDLSRQVGAAIFSNMGEVVALGSNEVPKANGGTYWSDGEFDFREYVRGFDSNDQRKREILGQIAKALAGVENVDDILKWQEIADSQFMDALEYGRIVHAEMSAISDAARLGRATKDGILFCTTFPCHMCAKHIIASGIGRVVFLEPYPKSLAFDLHADAIEIEGGDRGQFSQYPSVKFEHFFGVTPMRYRELFERGKRKDEKGNFLEYVKGVKAPIMDIKHQTYLSLEKMLIDAATKPLADLGDDETIETHIVL